MKVLAFVAIVCACGAAPHREASRPAPPARQSTPPVAAPTATDCDKLFEHAVALAAAERPDARLTDDDRVRVRGELAQAYGPACRAMSRDGYRCSVAASSLAELDACDHATRNSSTSNSSVAPGGIAPAAPRSP